MLRLLDIEAIAQKLKPVTSHEIYQSLTMRKIFHPHGLFSNEIFGSTDEARQITFAYINLNTYIFHPAVVELIKKVNNHVLRAALQEDTYALTASNELVQDPRGEIKGYAKIIDVFGKIKFDDKGNQRYRDIINFINHAYKNNLLFINKLIVIPPFYRDIIELPSKITVVDPLNDLYINVIKLSKQLYTSSGDVKDLLTVSLHEEVMKIYNYILNKISKKHGLLRGHILGKRIDFSGRAVIVGDPTMPPDHLGIPLKIALKIFEPFIIHYIMTYPSIKNEIEQLLLKFKNQPINVSNLQMLFQRYMRFNEISPELELKLLEIAREVTKDKVVIAKRDPVLHAESVQGFYPYVILGNVIKINGIKCSAYNADFDGDQMCVYTVFSDESIKEVKDKMITSVSKDGIGKHADILSKDLLYSVLRLLKDPDPKKGMVQIKDLRDIFRFDIDSPIIFDSQKTSVGRVIFNKIILDLKNIPFINRELSPQEIHNLLHTIWVQNGKEIYYTVVSRLLTYAVKFYDKTLALKLSDLILPEDLNAIRKSLFNESLSMNDFFKLSEAITDKFREYIKNNPQINIHDLLHYHLLKSFNSVAQISITKGIIEDWASGGIKKIPHSLGEGLDARNYFNMGYACRSGMADRALNTSSSGYLFRQLVYATQRVELNTKMFDCGTKRFIEIKVTEDLVPKLRGRYIFEDGQIKEIGDPQTYLNQVIKLKTPIYCQSENICFSCYGKLGMINQTENIGILASQVIGERGTQLIMRTFHKGGSIELLYAKIFDILNRIYSDQILEVVKRYVIQKDDYLYSLDAFIISASSKHNHISFGSDIGQYVLLTNGVFDMQLNNQTITVPLMSPIKIYGEFANKKHKHVVIKINKDKMFAHILPNLSAFRHKIKSVYKFFDGKIPFRKPEEGLMILYNFYKDEAKNIDLVHFEVILSVLLRDKDNPSYPARLNVLKYQPVFFKPKAIPSLESWVSYIAFESPKEAINVGLLYERSNKVSKLEEFIITQEYNK